MRGIKCPLCGSRNTARYIYGMPVYDEKMMKDEKEGRIKIAECIINTVDVEGKTVQTDPEYCCRDCRKKFGSTPLYKTKDGYKDIREHVREISFTAGGYLTGTTTVEIKKTVDGASVEVSSLVMDGHFGDFTISEGSWKRLVYKLYDHMFLNDWKHDYQPEGFLIMDGDFWSLDITLDDGRKRRYHGSNAYPAYWSSLTYTMEKLIKNKVI